MTWDGAEEPTIDNFYNFSTEANRSISYQPK